MAGQGVTFEHRSDGPNGWVVAGTGWLVGIGLVIMALALFSLANWLGAALATLAGFAGWSMLAVAVGEATLLTCRGIALIVKARGQARALERQAAAQDKRAAAQLAAARRAPSVAVDKEVGFVEHGRR